MPNISISEAAKSRKYSVDDITNAVETYDLKVVRSADDKISSVDSEALDKVLAASDSVQQQTSLSDKIKALAQAIKKQTEGKLSISLTALTAVAASGAAILSLLQMQSSNRSDSARARYDVMFSIAQAADAITLSTDVATRTALAQTLDTRVELLAELHRGGVIVNEDWTITLKQICTPMNARNYYGLGDTIFTATKNMCESAKSSGEWSPP